MSGTKRDYYDVLGVQKGASADEIEKAYGKLARKYHPDRNIGEPDAEHKFREVTEAYEILSSEDKRERYDRYGHAGLDPNSGGFGPAGATFTDLFSDIVSAFMGGGGGRRSGGGGSRRGSDRREILEVQLHEVLHEARKNVSVRRLEQCADCGGKGTKSGKRATCPQCNGRGEYAQRQGIFELRQTCSRCHGEGAVIADPCGTCRGEGRVQVTRTVEVKVPAGSDTGLKLLLSGDGDAGQAGGERGDLEVVVRVADHPDFQRDGVHLVCAVPVSYSQAALGASIEIPTLTGKAKLEIPRGTQSHTELRVAAEGLPELRVDRHGRAVPNSRRGDLRVLVVIDTPQTLSKRQEELLRELAETEQKDVAGPRKGFIDRVKGWFSASDERK
jgi:molecular chaperone DnaJ